VGNESTQEIEDGMPHEVSVAPAWVGHPCPTLLNLNFAGGSMNCSPVAGRWGQVFLEPMRENANPARMNNEYL
jgi:hypothetical protein